MHKSKERIAPQKTLRNLFIDQLKGICSAKLRKKKKPLISR